jgi:hypothetical protein
LIHKKEMPVTLAVFIDRGVEEGERAPTAKDVIGASEPKEYAAADDTYVRFLIEEFIPGALKGYNLTKNGAGHAIVGPASGGFAAFTAAWIRPEVFQKVISHTGRFADSDYPDKIRAAARKPLRLALQTGAEDQPDRNEPKTDRPALHHQSLVAALAEKNYDQRVDTGAAKAILADQLRWLWRDYLQTPPDFEELAAHAPPAASFGTPGTRWEVAFDGMSSPVTYEFRANGVLYWVEYQVSDNYEFRGGDLITTSTSDPTGRYRLWKIKDNTFSRVIHNTGPDVELGLTARGTFKRIP